MLKKQKKGNKQALKILEQFDNRHERCIATDGDYSPMEQVTLLSRIIKLNYMEDRKSIVRLINIINKLKLKK